MERQNSIQHLETYLKNVKTKIQNERAKKMTYMNTYKEQLRDRGDSCESAGIEERITTKMQAELHQRSQSPLQK